MAGRSLMIMALAAAGLGGIIWAGAARGGADAARLLAYGEHLSGECTTCHRRDGADRGIPSITGWDVDHFVETMKFYKNGFRQNPAMVNVAKSLDDEQMLALAVYFKSLPPPAKKEEPAKGKGKKK